MFGKRCFRGAAGRAGVLLASALALLLATACDAPSSTSNHDAGNAKQTGSSTAAPACRLPLVITQPNDQTAGFVSPATGKFDPDPAADPHGLPFPRFSVADRWRPVTYVALFRTWLPVPSQSVSPDLQSFAYVVANPPFSGNESVHRFRSELHVYDLLTSGDRVIWSVAADMTATPPEWVGGQILVATVPLRGGTITGTLVDAATGSRTSADPPRSATMGGQLDGVPVGMDSGGRTVEAAGNGLSNEYYAEASDGSRIVVKPAGLAGPPGFEPSSLVADGERVWGANSDGTALWMWTRRGGLKRFPLEAGPKKDPYVVYRVAGPCV